MKGYTRTEAVRKVMDRLEPEQFYGFDNSGKVGGTVHFEGMTGADARAILEALDAEDPEAAGRQRNDQQNAAPSFLAFADFAAAHPGVTLFGYRVVESRSDERITVEGAYVPATYKRDLEAFIGEKAEANPDERDGRGVIRVWWD